MQLPAMGGVTGDLLVLVDGIHKELSCICESISKVLSFDLITGTFGCLPNLLWSNSNNGWCALTYIQTRQRK